ncbi:MAG: hypothetical protein AB1566_15175, partial [Chloroflexota bacterium]
ASKEGTMATVSAGPVTPTFPPEAGRVVDLARKDLAQRLGKDQDAITVVRVERVDWPDTSLGCPQPGMMYAQVITPGYRIYLSVDNVSYEYHSDRARVVFCPAKKRMKAPFPGSTQSHWPFS